MRIIFMGTPGFAVPSLQILVENDFEVVGVVTATDKYGGRGGKKLIESPVKKYAIENNIPVLQPNKLKDPIFIESLQNLKADLQIVVAFRMLPVVVWDMPKHGTYNLHGSLLPKYRGAAPINWAIINGETETGVTSFKLKHKIDTGDLCFQASLAIDENDTATEIHDKMMYLGADTVLKTVKAIDNDSISFTPQDDSLACPAPKIFHEDCLIDFNKPSKEVHDFIRGLAYYPSAHTNIDGLDWKIYKTLILEEKHKLTAGTIVTDNKKHLKIACTDGFVDVLEAKPAGKRMMKIGDILNGLKVNV